MKRKKIATLGIILISFGMGIFLECCFPSSFIVCIIAIAIVIVGLIICKC